MDPMTIAALIGAGSQAATGLYQLYKGGQIDAKQTPYQIPQEAYDMLEQAKNRQVLGLPSESLNYYRDRAASASARALRNASTRQAGIAGLGDIAQVEMETGRRVAMEDANMRRANQQARDAAILQAQQQLAQYKDKAFEIQRQREDLKAQEKGALAGAGLQNLMGSVQSGLNTYAQGQYLKTLGDKNKQIANEVLKATTKFTPTPYDINATDATVADLGKASSLEPTLEQIGEESNLSNLNLPDGSSLEKAFSDELNSLTSKAQNYKPFQMMTTGFNPNTLLPYQFGESNIPVQEMPGQAYVDPRARLIRTGGVMGVGLPEGPTNVFTKGANVGLQPGTYMTGFNTPQQGPVYQPSKYNYFGESGIQDLMSPYGGYNPWIQSY